MAFILTTLEHAVGKPWITYAQLLQNAPFTISTRNLDGCYLLHTAALVTLIRNSPNSNSKSVSNADIPKIRVTADIPHALTGFELLQFTSNRRWQIAHGHFYFPL
jgi:hypothetical protein